MAGQTFSVDNVRYTSDKLRRIYDIITEYGQYSFYGHEVELIMLNDDGNEDGRSTSEKLDALEKYLEVQGSW